MEEEIEIIDEKKITWDEIKKEIETNDNIDWGEIREKVKSLGPVERGKMMGDADEVQETRKETQIEFADFYNNPENLEKIKEEQLKRLDELEKY